MREHTPGPWGLDRVRHSEDLFTLIGNQIIVDPTGVSIGLACAVERSAPDATGSGLANARLMAAAPDLLAACKAVESTVEYVLTKHFPYCTPPCETCKRRPKCELVALRAAIAKAEGRDE